MNRAINKRCSYCLYYGHFDKYCPDPHQKCWREMTGGCKVRFGHKRYNPIDKCPYRGTLKAAKGNMKPRKRMGKGGDKREKRRVRDNSPGAGPSSRTLDDMDADYDPDGGNYEPVIE